MFKLIKAFTHVFFSYGESTVGGQHVLDAEELLTKMKLDSSSITGNLPRYRTVSSSKSKVLVDLARKNGSEASSLV